MAAVASAMVARPPLVVTCRFHDSSSIGQLKGEGLSLPLLQVTN